MDEKDLVGISSEYLRLTNGLLTDQTFWRDRMLIASTIFTFVVYLLYVFGYSIAQNMAWHNGFPWLLILAIPYGLFFFLADNSIRRSYAKKAAISFPYKRDHLLESVITKLASNHGAKPEDILDDLEKNFTGSICYQRSYHCPKGRLPLYLLC
ncbi:hypothetical protein HAP94_13120 [Acidithiobacillus ferrivorans]|nr:hypothetical protein [Acidithiobacillus ferrivorans]